MGSAWHVVHKFSSQCITCIISLAKGCDYKLWPNYWWFLPSKYVTTKLKQENQHVIQNIEDDGSRDTYVIIIGPYMP